MSTGSISLSLWFVMILNYIMKQMSLPYPALDRILREATLFAATIDFDPGKAGFEFGFSVF